MCVTELHLPGRHPLAHREALFCRVTPSPQGLTPLEKGSIEDEVTIC